AEMGRVVLPGPYFSTVVPAGHAIAEAGTDTQRKELLPAICAGELLIAFADTGSDVGATADGSSFRLDGDAQFVIDGGAAQRVVVAADTGLFLSEPAESTPLDVLDATRKVARLRVDGEGVCLRRLSPRRVRRHPDPRWHRLYLGARHAPVLQAREGI